MAIKEVLQVNGVAHARVLNTNNTCFMIFPHFFRRWLLTSKKERFLVTLQNPNNKGNTAVTFSLPIGFQVGRLHIVPA
jgi:hypothetical protein